MWKNDEKKSKLEMKRKESLARWEQVVDSRVEHGLGVEWLNWRELL